MHHVNLPCSDSNDGSRISYKLPVIHPYELLNNEMSESLLELEAKLSEHVQKDILPLYIHHTPLQFHLA